MWSRSSRSMAMCAAASGRHSTRRRLPEQARRLYEFFVDRVRAAGLRCETGRFQEMMQVELVNEGPVTILLDSAKAF